MVSCYSCVNHSLSKFLLFFTISVARLEKAIESALLGLKLFMFFSLNYVKERVF
jgi:hypothetical protein